MNAKYAGWAAYASAGIFVADIVLDIILSALGILKYGPRSHSALIEAIDVLWLLSMLPLVLALYPLRRSHMPRLSLLAAIIGTVSIIYMAVLHALFVFEVLWFFDSLTVFLTGLAGVSLWLLIGGYLGQSSGRLPRSLIMSIIAVTWIGYPIWAVWLGRQFLSGRLAVSE